MAATSLAIAAGGALVSLGPIVLMTVVDTITTPERAAAMTYRPSRDQPSTLRQSAGRRKKAR